jgi:ElaB/YqjD/DUF883 family membrane-anchored ribosome-binding protein
MAAPTTPQSGREEPGGASAKAEEAASQAKDKVEEKAQDLKGQASQRLRAQLDTHSTRIGEQASVFAEALRKSAGHLRNEGNDGGAKAATRAAEQVDRLSGYLKSSSSDRFLRDVENFARERPWLAGALGAAAGFVAARFLKASSDGAGEMSPQAQRDAELPLRREIEAGAPLPPPRPPVEYGSR